MPPRRRRINKQGNKNHHIILVVLLIVAGVFFLIREPGKQESPKKFANISKPDVKKKTPPVKAPSVRGLPRVALIIDDLGPNRKKAEAVLKIKVPLTLSILPQETYSAWIAEQGHKAGLDIIAHIPAEATKAMKLGKGGLFTWMTDDEIRTTLEKDLSSVPHIIGASTHMGSAFTTDRRAMKVFLTTIKKQGLFFLDSYTTAESIGLTTAKEMGIKTDRRHVFLDNSNKPSLIKAEWERLMKLAKEQGYAIAIAHPRMNSLAFLKKTLPGNDDVEIVPLTALIYD